MATFSPKAGCPLCGIVASAVHAPSHSPRSPSFPAGSTQPEILWRDENFTAYRERANPVSSAGHIIIAFNLHIPSLYTLSSSDLPLLVSVRDLAQRLLRALVPPHSPTLAPFLDATSPTSASSLDPPSPPRTSAPPRSPPPRGALRIGFITPPFHDTKIPVTDHLHAHAFLEPADRLGWWRGVAYSPLAWYAIDDLIAEIREETSNNRVRSGMKSRPIDTVPYAGARTGTADGIETTAQSLAAPDLEDGHNTAAPAPLLLAAPPRIPRVHVSQAV